MASRENTTHIIAWLAQLCWRVKSFRCNATLYNRSEWPRHEGRNRDAIPRFAAIVIECLMYFALASGLPVPHVSLFLQPAAPRPEPCTGEHGRYECQWQRCDLRYQTGAKPFLRSRALQSDDQQLAEANGITVALIYTGQVFEDSGYIIRQSNYCCTSATTNITAVQATGTCLPVQRPVIRATKSRYAFKGPPPPN